MAVEGDAVGTDTNASGQENGLAGDTTEFDWVDIETQTETLAIGDIIRRSEWKIVHRWELQTQRRIMAERRFKKGVYLKRTKGGIWFQNPISRA